MRPIDADALMEWVVDIGWGGRLGISLDELTNAIEDAPTVATDPPQGEWEGRIVGDCGPWLRRRFYCSNCGNWNTYGMTMYCPDCGAKMKGGG